MPEVFLTTEELEANQLEEDVKRGTVDLHGFCQEKVSQMQHNILRAEQGGQTTALALDRKGNPEGMTQYEIDKGIMAQYLAEIQELEELAPEYFKVEVSDVTPT